LALPWLIEITIMLFYSMANYFPTGAARTCTLGAGNICLHPVKV